MYIMTVYIVALCQL